MICPNCHGMDDARPNCVRCARKGGLCDGCGKPVFAGLDLCYPCHLRWKKEVLPFAPEDASRPRGEPEEKNLTADGAEGADGETSAAKSAKGAKKEKADTDGTHSTDEKQEVKVKTFVQRLEAMAVLLGAKSAERDHGLPDHARLNFWSEVKLVPRFLAAAPVDTVTRVLLRALAWMACRSDRVARGQPIPDAVFDQKAAEVLAMLEQKNASYGDTALNPVRTFSSGTALQLIYARADDKLNRLRKGQFTFEEDALMDLAGYLVLALLALEDEAGRKRSTADGAEGADGETSAAKSAKGAKDLNP